MAAGAVAGGLSGFAGTRPLGKLDVRVGPFSGELGGRRITVGPLKNLQFVYVLVDRAVLYTRFISQWAHARRSEATDPIEKECSALTTNWPDKQRSVLSQYYRAVSTGKHEKAAELQSAVLRILTERLLVE